MSNALLLPTRCMPVPLSTTIAPEVGMDFLNESLELFRTYSPVTLNQEWSRVGRLLVMLFCICYGSTMNGYYVATFFIDDTLRTNSYVYLACIGLSDLLITAGITPVSAVVILSGQWDNIEVCRVLQFVCLSTTYGYSTYFLFVAIENYYRISRPPEEYAVFLSFRTDITSLVICVLCFSLGAVGAFNGLDYDYCHRSHYGNLYFRAATMAIFQVIPAILTLLCLIVASVRVRQRARRDIKYKRSHLFERDYSMTVINTTVYLLYVMAWIPYVIIVNNYPSTNDAVYYNTISMGIIRATFSSTLYGIFHKNFRRAYANLFNYCCCKNSLPSSHSNRHRHRTMEYRSTIGEVRVHILHRAISTSTLRRQSCLHETYDL